MDILFKRAATCLTIQFYFIINIKINGFKKAYKWIYFQEVFAIGYNFV